MKGSSDVLVIGAGPAGSAAGIAAALAGARVCVVDRARFPRPKTCGDAVSNSAAAIIDELGAGDRFHAAPHAVVRGAAAIFPDGSRVKRSYEKRPGFIMEREVLDDVLRQRLQEVGAQVVEGVQVRRLLNENGRFVGAEGDSFEWRADAVITADGPGSLAWTALGEKAPRRSGLALAVTAYYENLPAFDDAGYSEHYFEAELPAGYGWIFPEVEGRANIGVYQRADRYHRAGVALGELLARFVGRHEARFGRARMVGRTRSWQLPLASPRPPSGAAGLLACGDAGRLVDPLTGEGIWHALFSGRLAGRAAAEAVAGEGLDAQGARRYRLASARAVAWPSALRIGIQETMAAIVGLGLYRSRAVRGLLEWGYGRSALEVSKSVD
jgi:menaquinone-9 beta-reductase